MARLGADHGLLAMLCGWLVCVAAATAARGDGCFLPPLDYSGQDLTEPSQRAVVVHCDGRESLFLFVDYQGASDRFAWIVPCPAKPDVRTAGSKVLLEVAKYYHHLEVLRWQEELRQRGGDEGQQGGGGPQPESQEVRIHEVKLAGPYEIAIVSANEGESLAAWLTRNGYAAPANAAPILQKYIDQRWYFAAIKVRAVAGRLQTLPPILLQFPTDMPIYPLRISAINPGLVDVLVYYLGARAELPAGYEDLGAYALRDDFRKLCPTLAGEVPDLPWHKLQLSRISDTLTSHVMRRLDDRIHRQTLQGPEAFYPLDSLAQTVGIAEALASSDAAVASWGEARLSYYLQAKPRPGEFPTEQLAALGQAGRRLGPALRDRLLACIGARVTAAKQRAASFRRADWSGYLMTAQDSTNLEGAVILLVRTCEPGDRQVQTALTEIVRATGAGTYWDYALRDLNQRRAAD